MSRKEIQWIARDYLKCSGCRKCEIACSVFHEKKIWPEASRIRVFMLVPGAEIPHLCAQCHDFPCVNSCPEDALSVDKKTKAVVVDKERCTACGTCIEACPGRIPYIHPTQDYAVICDLCGGEPRCVRVCRENEYNCLSLVKRPEAHVCKLYAKRPEQTTRNLIYNLYGESARELI